MDIISIYNVMRKLETTSGKLAKEKILKDNEDNTDFREALVFLLNPYIVTGISTKKMKKKITPKKDVKIPTIRVFSEMLNYLKENNSGRDIDILAIKQYADQFELHELYDFMLKFATKDIKLGISEKTVNKIYGKGTIPSFAVQLAESFEKKGDKVTDDFYVTLKLDGNRCVAMNGEDGLKFFSRKGQPIEGMVELIEEFKKLPKGWVFDGELLLTNEKDIPSDELFRATQKVVRKDGDKKNLEFYVFDALPIAEFEAGKSKLKYRQRRNNMNLMFAHLDETPHINLLPVLYEGNDKSVIPVLLKGVEKEGFEGLMVNTANGLYQNKRTVDLMKVKTMKTSDLLVMSVEKSIDGQFEGLLGRVNVEYKGQLVGVGSGFTLDQRKEFVENPDLICGMIIEVQHFGESQDEKTGLPSLRFPIFKGIRHDKDVEDINYGE